MASSALAVRLTETHRLAQARLGNITKQQVEALWPALDLDRLDATFPAWLEQVNRVVGSAHALSASTAAAYYATFRRLELGPHAKPMTPIRATLNGDALATSMEVTGPVAIKSALSRGVALLDAAATARAGSAGAALRRALSGGRDTISETVTEDPRALGWARAADGNACAFCAMLAGRGPVYSEDSVDFEAHDHCTCSSEPVYDTDAPWPEHSERYRQIYNDATADVPVGGDLLNAFRQAYESRPA
jgi:hypothetical protein